MLDLLGLPDSDENMMRHWSDRCSNFLFQSVAPDKRAARNSRRAASVFHAADRGAPSRARRRHDFGQACAEVAGERLSDLEILATCHMMATAGGGTSRSAIAMSLWWLQWFPDQLAALKARPELIDLDAEEFLRFDAPTQRGIRTARQDFSIGGKDIRKGELLHIMIGAANRDPDQFEDPDRLIVTRSPNRHVSLGHGVHYCLGAALMQFAGSPKFWGADPKLLRQGCATQGQVRPPSGKQTAFVMRPHPVVKHPNIRTFNIRSSRARS